MTTVNTNDLRIQNSKNFVKTLTEDETNTYLFVGRVNAWENDELPPTPDNSVREFYRAQNEMLALQSITPLDVYHMIPKVRWTSGVIYDMYRHDYSSELLSFQGANNLLNSIFYVINQNNDVYVCLYNDVNTPSTVEPQNKLNEPFFTSDGYQWLRLYNVSDYYLKNRSTQNLMPIINQDNNTKLPEGAVYTVVIDSPGNGYTRSPQGKSNQLIYYYCKIVGDGEGAVARIKINNSEVFRVDIVRPGRNYTYGKVDFVANRVYEKLSDLDNDINGLNPRGDGTFRSTVIISPPGGWGTDLVRELGATRVGVFSELDFTYDELLPNTSFRQVGILHDPETAQEKPSSMIGCYGVKINAIDQNNEFKFGEQIEQFVLTYDSIGNVVSSHKAIGQVAGFDDSDPSLLRYVQIPELHADENGVMYRLQGSQEILGTETGKRVQPDVSFNGLFKGAIFSSGYSVPEFSPYSGQQLYLTNISPVKRQETQTEKISLIVSY